MGILVLNAGSSSLKFAIYTRDAKGAPKQLERGQAESAEDVLRRAERVLGVAGLAAVGHRVVMGGLEQSKAALIDADELDRLRALVPLAPLHQPLSLAPIEMIARNHLRIVQVACFDTAFHRTIPAVAQRYALPRALTDAGARRFGFHGLSYEYIAGALSILDPASARKRVIVAHLGAGASLCVLVDGRSIATTMGFSPLSGLVMATRPGELDPGLVLWLQRTRHLDAERVESLLYHECGLAGVSGISGDMRVLLASTDARAREAIEIFVYRIVRETGSLAAACGGIDAFVFTGGIGEHAAPVRAMIARGRGWLGFELDTSANERHGPFITRAESRVRGWVMPTDEEAVMARQTAELAFGHVA